MSSASSSSSSSSSASASVPVPVSVCSHFSSSVRQFNSNQFSLHRSECTQCFDSDSSPAGINLCLTCFNGGCNGDRNHSLQHFQVTGHAICLNIVKFEIPKVAASPEPVSSLAAAVANASPAGPEYRFETKFYCHTCKSSFPVESADHLSLVDSLLHQSAAGEATADEGDGWTDNPAQVCAHTTNLVQDASAPPIDTRNPAKCSKCDFSDRLWLCLTCGHRGCPRKQFGEENSGSGHGIQHFEESGHPIVLKLGTIKPEGTADLYCYSCDQSVLDSHLASHLSHFGINILNETATEKSTAELQLESNLKWKWSKSFDEDGKELEAKYGSGYCGLENLGNSCYLASVAQVLFALPQFQHRYFHEGREHLLTCRNGRPADCFLCQMAKLADGIQSGRYSVPPENHSKEIKMDDENTSENSKKRKQELQPGVPPRMFKRLIARDHPEFSKTKQQDALEFLQFFLTQIQQREKINQIDPTAGFQFKFEEKLQCSGCKGVKYSIQPASEVSLGIPVGPPKMVDNANKKTQRKEFEPVKFAACVEDWAKPVELENYRCAVCGAGQKAIKQTRFQTFPDTLIVHMRRFVFDSWIPEKLDCDILIDGEMQFDQLRASGPQAGEIKLPEDQKPASGPKPSEAIVAAIEGMGFSKNAGIRAALAVQNSSAEAASEWIFSHMEDANINDPIQSTSASNSSSAPPELVAQLESMGFPASKCQRALAQCQNNVDRAIEWLFSHMEDDGEESAPSNSSSDSAAPAIDGKPARYRLFGYITHLGASTGSGHYVACVMKEGKWVLFNDSRVTVASPTSSKSSPSKAYIYFFRRIPG